MTSSSRGRYPSLGKQGLYPHQMASVSKLNQSHAHPGIKSHLGVTLTIRLNFNQTYLYSATFSPSRATSRKTRRSSNLVESHPIGIQSNFNNLLVALGIQTNPKYLNLASALKRNLQKLSSSRHVVNLPILPLQSLASFSVSNPSKSHQIGLPGVHGNQINPIPTYLSSAISPSKSNLFSPSMQSLAVNAVLALSVGPKILRSVPCSNTSIVIF